MKRTLLPFMIVVLLAMSSSLLAAPPPQQAAADQNEPTQMIQGKWRATVAERDYVLDLRVEDGDLLGTVTLPDGTSVEVEDGICVSEEFSFATVENDVEWEWNGTVSESGLEGERERFDTDATEDFTATRMP